MILLLAGTSEGRRLAAKLQQDGFAVQVCTATTYGGSLISGQTAGLKIISRRLDAGELGRLINSPEVTAVVDATHPYATKITTASCSIAQNCGKPYYRWQRSSSDIPWDSPLVHRAGSYREAAAAAASRGRNVLLTTGSSRLAEFTSQPAFRNKRLIARVLALPQAIQCCIDSGIQVKDIIALQGPCSEELNRAIYLQYGVDVVISKDSGRSGGTEAKVKAAIGLNLPVVIIERPQDIEAGLVENYQQLYRLLKGDKT